MIAVKFPDLNCNLQQINNNKKVIKNLTYTPLYMIPIKTSRLSLGWSSQSVDLSFSNSSYTPCTITLLVSPTTDRTPCMQQPHVTQAVSILIDRLNQGFPKKQYQCGYSFWKSYSLPFCWVCFKEPPMELTPRVDHVLWICHIYTYPSKKVLKRFSCFWGIVIWTPLDILVVWV